MSSPPRQSDSRKRLESAAAVRRIILAIVGIAAFTLPLLARQNSGRPSPTSRWEAVSVKPCAVRGSRGGGTRLSPGRMALNCQPVTAFIAWAYVQYAGGRARPFYSIGTGGTVVEGGPSWIYSDRYTIEATVNGTPSDAMMQGPMLQAILEDRFKVKVHTETREVPAFRLPFLRVNATATASSHRRARPCRSMRRDPASGNS